MNKRSCVVVVLSGGLDSSTLLHKVNAEFPSSLIHAISFNYGQRHKKELEFAAHQAATIGASHRCVSLSSITGLFEDSGSSLVTGEDVPEGHYGEESMKKTVVPNRNMIMASIATGYAVSLGADYLFLGVHAGDHFIYPDCRPEFFGPLNTAIVRGNAGFGQIHKWNEDAAIMPQQFVQTPFIQWTKNDIAAEAVRLGVDIANTWSCYKGGDIHCGKCGTCVERLEAIASTGIVDPTTYEDDQFWREALKRETV